MMMHAGKGHSAQIASKCARYRGTPDQGSLLHWKKGRCRILKDAIAQIGHTAIEAPPCIPVKTFLMQAFACSVPHWELEGLMLQYMVWARRDDARPLDCTVIPGPESWMLSGR